MAIEQFAPQDLAYTACHDLEKLLPYYKNVY